MATKTILITGAGSGVGKGLAQFFGARGFSVLVTDLDAAAAQQTVSEILADGGEAKANALDVTDQQAIACLLETFSEHPPDILINNAGLQHVSPLEDFPPEKWELLIDVMLKGACWMTRAVLPAMRANGFGRIINIGSIHSLVASPFKSAYVAAKHGLLGFSKTMALETAGEDITVNTICPSYVLTPLVEKQIAAQAASHGISEDDVKVQIMLKPMPKKAFIGMDEIAGTAAFLCSAEAKNITGQTITIDGGWTIQ